MSILSRPLRRDARLVEAGDDLIERVVRVEADRAHDRAVARTL